MLLESVAAKVLGDWLLPRIAKYEADVVVAGGVAAALAASGGVLAVGSGAVPIEFYSAAAQINPVFLVTLAIEQRLVERVGMTEEQYVRRAAAARDIAVRAAMAFQNDEPEKGRRLEDEFRSYAESQWVAPYAEDYIYGDPTEAPDIDLIARHHYRTRQRSQAAFVLAVIALVCIGEGAALGGLMLNGTTGRSVLFVLCLGALAGAFVCVTLAAVRDLIRSIVGR